MAIIFGDLLRAWKTNAALGILPLVVLAASVWTDSLDNDCVRESNYYCIKVRARDIGDREVRILYLDALLHSYVDIKDPLFLHYSYEKVFGDVASEVAHRNPNMDSLFIGGGGYTMPRFLEVMFPSVSVEVVEIDPEVTEVATEYLALPLNTSIITYTEDARTKLQELPKGKYEFIVGDAFNDVSVPYHLTTLEFNGIGVRASLRGRCLRHKHSGQDAQRTLPAFGGRYAPADISTRLCNAGQHILG